MKLREGDVYTTNAEIMRPMRRVLGVVQGKVVYSVGGDSNGICKLETFERWCKRWKAKLIHRPKEAKK